MDLNSVGKLLQTICIHYPAFQKHVAPDGAIQRAYAEEWLRVIGFLDYEEALQKFDQYLKLPEGNKYAPDVKWFLTVKTHEQPRNEWFNSAYHFDRIDSRGRLTDAEGRLYAFPEAPDEVYHYTETGHIADSKGKVLK